MPTTYSYLEAGTPIIWGPSGTGQDKLITLTSLGANAAREGEKSGSLIHPTKGMPELLVVRLQTAVSNAARTGTTVELYFGESTSPNPGDDNPAGLSGADSLLGSWESTIQIYEACILYLRNSAGTNVQSQDMVYYPKLPYIIPVVLNRALKQSDGSGNALSGTASDHRIRIIPFYRKHSTA